MRIWSFRHAALGVCAATMLSGCGGSQPPIGASDAPVQSRAIAASPNNKNYKVLYSFGKVPDANNPRASLIDVNGTFYGTTQNGGYGWGTVFSITPSGTETVLYSFGAAPDGETPLASLIDVDGTLYGTTSEGGSNTCGGYQYYPSVTCGTVFSVTLEGTETVLHSFGAGADGVEPLASLIDVNGTLYGTTFIGGAGVCEPAGHYRCGTVFNITTSGSEKVVVRFAQRVHPHWPHAGLINVGGTFYGATERGGRYKRYGTVFSITRSGKVKVLHSFDSNGTDGFYPLSLIEVGGTLYGTTYYGGVYGGGTVFSITASGTEKVLHSFGNGTDGARPVASLIDANGTLYGITSSGGEYAGGTVFSLTQSGTEQVLHSFGHGKDGSDPVAALIDVNGTLYGTTESGGTQDEGAVFALTP